MTKKLVLGFVMGLLTAVVTGFAQNAEDFQMNGRTLVKYKGRGGDVTVPAGVTSIGQGAFSASTNLRSIVLPEGVIRIGANAFDNCKNLTSITLPASLTSIGQGAFRVTGLRGITLPDGITTIEANTFYSSKSLTGITLPASLTSIGNGAFDGCESLAGVVLPRGVTSIGTYAFRGCASLSSILLPEGLTSIGDYAFVRCTRLSGIMLPESLTGIGKDIFGGGSSINVFVSGEAAYQFPPSVTVLDAASIVKRVREDYVSNPRTGDANWKGKLIGVTANVEHFEDDGSVIVVQTVNGTVYRSLCRFNASSSGDLIRYDVGSEITLMGTVVGMERLSSGASGVVLSHCIPVG
ncbi:MAG: leucine-rich repeat domain-containing protein [Spirochaetaceae bacterium]|nr:leucine-rich repeat domain-containing protein [Spirochaetaceae bacterium]